MFFNLEKNLKKGRYFQPYFKYKKIFISFVGAFIAIYILGVVSIFKDQSLMIAPFGASSVLLFGIEDSPLAQPRNLIIGNLFGGIAAVFSFNCFGINSFSCGLAVAIAIALGQLFRSLHPPAGAVALLGVISKANLNFVLSPVLLGSLVLVIWGIIFNRLFNKKTTYPVHWI
tara:strand:- start:1918 stop:2433 length:516 start_codon:yes stop_codon:yes gene_type:complete